MSTESTIKFCPQCLIEGKGQHPLRRTEVWSNSSELDKPFHETHYTCPNCGNTYFDID